MNLRDIRELKQTAARRLDSASEVRKIVLIYAGITVGASLLVTVVSYVLGLQMSQTGGLGSMGIRSILSTVQTMLPILQTLALMCLDLGYLSAMLRIGRGQYTSARTLKAGVQRFWTMVRCTLLKSMVYMFLAMLSFYLATLLFVLSPLSEQAMEMLLPAVEAADMGYLMEAAAYLTLMGSLLPLFILYAVLMAVLVIPVSYRLRMANYVLLDKPGLGARAVLRESKKLMTKNCFALFKLDLSLWWYHALTALSVAVCYGDSILSLMGISLPWSAEFGYFLFYGLYLVMLFAITCLLRSRVEVTYALAYDAIRPEENSDGVVLGNIFTM